jgi:hypothetical protein
MINHDVMILTLFFLTIFTVYTLRMAAPFGYKPRTDRSPDGIHLFHSDTRFVEFGINSNS